MSRSLLYMKKLSTLSLMVLCAGFLSACIDGYELVRVNALPFADGRTAGSAVIYVRKNLMPKKNLKIKSSSVPKAAIKVDPKASPKQAVIKVESKPAPKQVDPVKTTFQKAVEKFVPPKATQSSTSVSLPRSDASAGVVNETIETILDDL